MTLKSGAGTCELADINPYDDTTPIIKSGITELDERIGGFYFAGIYCIGGGVESGKTTLAAQIAADADAAIIIANDMHPKLWRALIDKQHGGENPNCDFEFLCHARSAIDIEEICREWAAECKAKKAYRRVIIFDHTQSLSPDTDLRADSSERITALMNTIRRIANKTRAAVLLNCAIRKQRYEHGYKKLTMEDVRDGSAIVYQSDVVLLIDDVDNKRRRLQIAKDRINAAAVQKRAREIEEAAKLLTDKMNRGKRKDAVIYPAPSGARDDLKIRITENRRFASDKEKKKAIKNGGIVTERKWQNDEIEL